MAKHLSLAAKYRPQTFAQVAGQDMVKAVLSRAAAEDRPAAAYLLSGTRGVGKTTIARIFAKALNCEHAPGPEPCNECAQCRKITQGIHVDVTEIDGASNNSVEDARALRENIGYAPMEGRYKIFIIDEAHMLSRSAFNALLKTLEEPPERVVFIFATTEAHKFPVTIVSRCQHFVFRHLSEDALEAHLSHVLRREKVEFEEGAVRLLARRAAGSVRDSMSLLDQALALGGDRLTSEGTRQVLGLAGQELFSQLLDALQGRDCAAVAAISGQILQQGVDIGFFVRELAGNLRNLFLLRQSGPAVLPSLHLPADEAAFWQQMAPRFSAGQLHAAWQMTLEAQRGIVQSPEPAAALELLLLNLALLPQLLPVGNVAPQSGPVALPPDASHSPAGQGPRPPAATQHAGHMPRQEQKGTRQPAHKADEEAPAPEPEPAPAGPASAQGHPQAHPQARPHAFPQAGIAAGSDGDTAPGSGPRPASGTATAPEAGTAAPVTVQDAPPVSRTQGWQTASHPKPDRQAADSPTTGSPATGWQATGSPATGGQTTDSPATDGQATGSQGAGHRQEQATALAPTGEQPSSAPEPARAEANAPTPPGPAATSDTGAAAAAGTVTPATTAGTGPVPTGQSVQSRPEIDWPAFCEFCAARQEEGQPSLPQHLLHSVTAHWDQEQLVLRAKAQSLLHQLEKQRVTLEALLEGFGLGRPPLLFAGPPPVRSENELIAEFSKKEALQPCLEVLQANIVHCTPIK